MAHSMFKMDVAILMREDLISLVLNRLAQFVESRQDTQRYGWMLHAVAEWREEFEIMPPGAKCLNLEKWIANEGQQSAFVEGIQWIEDHLSDWIDEKRLTELREGGIINLHELRALVQNARVTGSTGLHRHQS